ncbi:Vps51/Vps67-domain-containing protein [Tricladium varicosporioides]|nr:Vps51/Vps67-domain-containing protein [Hymenoscyphus varicosporioides]
MTSIASPRETSVPARPRIPHISTPTSSSRPSFEINSHSPNLRSADASPNRAPPINQPKRANRAALREYYNLKKAQDEKDKAGDRDDAVSEASSIHDFHSSEVAESEMDRPDFDASSYTKHILETQSLSELLRTYNGILTDIRALDAEKKALVYDNYSKLIAATETIRKMRDNMDPLNPMASTLDPAIRGIYERCVQIKVEMKNGMSSREREIQEMGVEEQETLKRRQKTREVVERVLGLPRKMRELVKEGKEEEARALWEPNLRLLERWSERGVGGEDVKDCIEDGEAALRGEIPNEKS